MDTLKAHLPIIFFFVLSLTPIQITTMTPRSHFQMARSMCHGAFHPDLCISTLASFPGLASKSLPEIIIATLNRSAEEVRAASAHSTVVKKNLLTRLSMIEQALDICLELFQDILNDIANAVGYLEGSNSAARRHYFDLESLLSGVMANLYMCPDEFDPCTDNLKLGDSMKERLFKRLTPRRLSMRG